MKKQAQPFAAPVFWERHSQAAVISCVVGDFPVPLSIPIIASLRGHHASLSRPTRLSKGKKFLLSDGERGRSLIKGRMLTCSHLLPGRQSLDFLKPVIHIIITPSDNS